MQNYLKTIKFFCETTDISIPWKKITRGLPKGKRYADDRAPTLEEIKKIIEYPDRRIKPVVYTMESSGIRVGAWDHLRWHHITPIIKDGELIAAKNDCVCRRERRIFYVHYVISLQFAQVMDGLSRRMR